MASSHRNLNMSCVLQVLVSRFASPHVNIRLDSRPVSASVALQDAVVSDGAVLMATGNTVSTKPLIHGQ